MDFTRIPKCDLHTHSSFCDGENSPEKFVLSAIKKGMDAIGFSAHAPMPFETEATAPCISVARYREEVFRLQKKYREQISVFLGLEQDYYAADPAIGYDYLIGAVHCLRMGDEYVFLDRSAKELRSVVKRYFGGDGYRLVSYYYQLVANLPTRTGCEIVGHFDLITKFNGDGSFFDEKDPRYLRAAMDALDALLERDVLFEINSSDCVAGLRKIPYPAPLFLHRIAERRGRVILSSDAHCAGDLMSGFLKSARIARASGLGSVWTLTETGWESHSF